MSAELFTVTLNSYLCFSPPANVPSATSLLIAAIVPVYLTGSPASHVGVPELKSPQSLTTRSSLVDSL